MVTVAQPALIPVAPVLPDAAPSLARPGTPSPALAWDQPVTPAELNAIHTAIFLDNLRDTHLTNREIRKTIRVALRTIRRMTTRRIPVNADVITVASLAARFRPLPIPRPLAPRAPRSRSDDSPPPRTPTPPSPGPLEPRPHAPHSCESPTAHPKAADPSLARSAKDLLTTAAATATITPAPAAFAPSPAVAQPLTPSNTPAGSPASPAAPAAHVAPSAPAAIIATNAACSASAPQPAPLPPAKAAFLAPFLRERDELQAKLAEHAPEVKRLNAARLAHANPKAAEPSPAYVEANRRLEHFLRDTIHPVTTRLALLADLIRDHAP
jgi:hypothetical protein